MKHYFYIIFTTFVISWNLSCNSEPTMNEKREVFKTVAFDKEIIADLTKYDALASILLSNLDSIIKYKNARNYVIVIDNNEQSQQLREENCYMFFKGNDNYDIKKIPDHLSLIVDSLWLLIGQPLINICKEKEPASVRIWIKAL